MNNKNVLFSKQDTLVIKGITLLFLLFHHCFLEGRFETYVVDFSPFSEHNILILASFFKICVGMFVFLSGFGMLRSYKNNQIKESFSLLDYTKKRFASLWLKWFFIYIFCQVICFIIDKRQLIVYGSYTKSIIYFVIDLLGFADFFHTPLLVATWWYMSLAFILILIFPIITYAYKKIDIFIIPLGIILSYIVNYIYNPLGRWLVAFLLGIYCADHYIFERLKTKKITKNTILNNILKTIFLFVGAYYLIKFRQTHNVENYFYITDGFIPAYFIYLSYEIISLFKIFIPALMFIGKHSMNIFLIHSFIRGIYFESWTYHFKYWWLIIFMLLTESIIVSLIIEKIIEVTKYDKLYTRRKI